MKNFNEKQKIPTWLFAVIIALALITLISLASSILSPVPVEGGGGGSTTHKHVAAEPVVLQNGAETHYVIVRCRDCNEIIVDNTAKHVFIDGVCSICMYECACPEETLTHTWTDWNATDKTYTQTATCSLCKKVFEPETVAATRVWIAKEAAPAQEDRGVEIYVVKGMTWNDVYKLYDTVFYLRNWTDLAGSYNTLYPIYENGSWEMTENYLYHVSASVRPVRLTDKVIIYDDPDENLRNYVFR